MLKGIKKVRLEGKIFVIEGDEYYEMLGKLYEEVVRDFLYVFIKVVLMCCLIVVLFMCNDDVESDDMVKVFNLYVEM